MAKKYYAVTTLDGATWQTPVELSDVGAATLKPSGLHVATHAEGVAYATVDTPVSDDWCHRFEFTNDDGGFVAVGPDGKAYGIWVADEGWVHTDDVSFGHNIRSVSIEITLPPGTSRNYTRFVIEYSYTYGKIDVNYLPYDYPDGHIWRIENGGTMPFLTVAEVNTAAFQGSHKTVDIVHPTSSWVGLGNTFRFTADSSNDNTTSKTYAGSVTIHSLEIHGTGTPPLADDCAPAEGLIVFTTTDYGTTWHSIEALQLETQSAGLTVPLPVNGDFLFVGNLADGVSDNPSLVGDDENALIRGNLASNSMTNISPVIGSDSYGPVFDGNQAQAPRGSFDSPPSDRNTLFMIGSEQATDKVGVFVSRDILSDSPHWQTLVEPDTSVLFRKLVVSDSELYLFGEAASISYTDRPYNGNTLDDRSGNLSSAAEILAITGFN
jgi:hypothetical protein